jgi:FdhD protein
MGRRATRVRATRLTLTATGAIALTRPDAVTVEEPLHIRINHQSALVTMRTPGDDFDLALGFLITEGLLTDASDVGQLRHCQDLGEDGLPTYNVVDVLLRPEVAPPEISPRAFPATSSCGVCGKSSIEQVRLRSPYDVRADRQQIDPAVLVELPAQLRAHQPQFDRTGGLHAAALFTAGGQLLVTREDIGRHNAVDKVIGWAARQNLLPLVGCVLLVSSRASFELAQKAMMAGIPCLAAVSAPSSLAIELAVDIDLTLIGFLRPPRLTIYHDSGRLLAADRD